MNNLMIFEGNNVEVFDFEGKVLFNPRDVGRCLKLSESNIRNHVSEMNEKQVVKLRNSDTINTDIRKLNNAGENFITEKGVYKLVFASKTEKALDFQDWITDEVLPQIRETGGYIPITEEESDEQFLAKALIIAQRTLDKKAKMLEDEKRKNAILMHTKKTYTATEIAKEIGFKSAIALNRDLVDKKIQFKNNNTYVLYSKYSDLGYVSIKQEILDNGKEVYSRHFTQEGRNFILNLYNMKSE